jgi:ParB family chromosome partitioning protein
MPDSIHLIPLAEIDEAALTRDRTAHDDEAMLELRSSIAVNGLRMPIEVFELADPDDRRYGLISGFRRLAAFRVLHEVARDKDRYAVIPAFIREPQSVAEALTAMVEENAIRAEVSPWEQAMIAVIAHDRRVFDSIDQAIDTLYANFSPDKRRRLRAVTTVVEKLSDLMIAPERLSLRQLLRIAAAVTRNYGALMRHALETSTIEDPDEQWQRLLPVLAESETTEPVGPARLGGGPTRPRRTYDAPTYNLRIRREMTRDGWALQFTGRDAQSWLLDLVFDHIEALLAPANPGPKAAPLPPRPSALAPDA